MGLTSGDNPAPGAELVPPDSEPGLGSFHPHNTMARSDGSGTSPRYPAPFSTNCGSLENLKFSTRCGCHPKARQIRTMAFCDRHVSATISQERQCVLLVGMDSGVFVTTSSICRSVILRGTPTRGSSSKPSSPNFPKRSRHLPTVAPETCNFRLPGYAPELNPVEYTWGISDGSHYVFILCEYQ